MKEQSYLTQRAIIQPCQVKCLNFEEAQISDGEQLCLRDCLDKMAYFDNTVYELDSATSLAAQQGKPKKAFMYFTRRIEDLATPQ